MPKVERPRARPQKEKKNRAWKSRQLLRVIGKRPSNDHRDRCRPVLKGGNGKFQNWSKGEMRHLKFGEGEREVLGRTPVHHSSVPANVRKGWSLPKRGKTRQEHGKGAAHTSWALSKHQPRACPAGPKRMPIQNPCPTNRTRSKREPKQDLTHGWARYMCTRRNQKGGKKKRRNHGSLQPAAGKTTGLMVNKG